MINSFTYIKQRNAYPLVLISQIDVIDDDDLAEIETTLDIPEGSIDTSAVSNRIKKNYGYKILIAYENPYAYYPEPKEE